MSDFPFMESELAGQVGLGREELRGIRSQFREGEDFDFQKNRAVWSVLGVERLMSHLKLPLGAGRALSEPLPPDGGPAKKTAPAAGECSPCVVLQVWRATRNRHILEAFAPGADPGNRANVVRVKVRDNANFRRIGQDGRPMVFQAVYIQADYYELVGKCPRKAGVW